MATTTAPRAQYKYADNVYFQDGLWLTGILSGLLFLVLAVSLDAAGHVSKGMGTVVPVALGAILLGALMSFSRFDSFFALSHSLFVGLAWILWLMTQLPTAAEITPFMDRGLPEIQARTYFVLLRLLNWVDAAISNNASADNYVFIFEISFLLWWICFLGMWSILRFGYVWRVVVPAGLVLVVNAYYAPQSIVTLLAIFSILAFFLLVRTNLSENQLRWRDQHVHVIPDIGWDYVRTGLTYTVVVLTVAWLLPGLGRNAQIRQLLAPINERWEETSQDLNRLYQGLNRREESASSSFGRSLPLGGERNVGDGLIFNVESSAARYWRAVTFDTFDGRGWINTGALEAGVEPGQSVPVGGWNERKALTQTITLMDSTGSVVFGAPDIRSLSLPVDVLVEAAPVQPIAPASLGEGLPAAVEFSMVRARETLDIGDSYTLVSNTTTATEKAMREAGTDYPLEIVDRYVQLPEGFSPRVAELARTLTVSSTTPYDAARTIEGYLRTIPYNDLIAAPANDVDPLEYFLFDIREGYCDYYASSMAMMLRVLGIPARTASGYAEGIFDEETLRYYITERDAHTWVEVFFPDLGWVEFEPTAGESPLNRLSGEEGETPIANSASAQSQPTPFSEGNPNPQNFDEGELLTESAQETGGLPWWAWLVALPVLLGGGIWMIRRMGVGAGPTAFAPDLPLLLFERLQRWAARLGLAPEASQTPLEQARRWGAALPEAKQPIQQITDSYVRYRFAPQDAQTAANAQGNTMSADAEAWKTLQPVLMSAWFKRWMPGAKSVDNGQFTLSSTEESHPAAERTTKRTRRPKR